MEFILKIYFFGRKVKVGNKKKVKEVIKHHIRAVWCKKGKAEGKKEKKRKKNKIKIKTNLIIIFV